MNQTDQLPERAGPGEADSRPPASAPKSLVRDYAETIIIAVLFVLFIKTFAFQQFKIPTGSMEDTLLIGDHLMVNKFIYGLPTDTLLDAVLPTRAIRRRDVVVFRFPQDPEIDFIKRAMGLPQDRISLKNKTLYINREAAVEDYIKVRQGGYHHAGDFYAERVVEDRHYFMLGDNRDDSNDSRFWGYVPEELVRGRAFLIWWSFAEDPGAWEQRDLNSRMFQVYDKIRHFFAKTRWRRMFTLVR